jgi:hypothetical protein
LLDEFIALLLGKLQNRWRYLIGFNNLYTGDPPSLFVAIEVVTHDVPFLAMVIDRLPTHEIHDALELILSSNRHLHCCSR